MSADMGGNIDDISLCEYCLIAIDNDELTLELNSECEAITFCSRECSNMIGMA